MKNFKIIKYFLFLILIALVMILGLLLNVKTINTNEFLGTIVSEKVSSFRKKSDYQLVFVDGNSIEICPKAKFDLPKYKILKNNHAPKKSPKIEVQNKNDYVIYQIGNKKYYYYINPVDNIKPSIILKGDSNIYLKKGEKYNELGVSVKDNCNQDIANKVKIEGLVDTEKKGKYTIKYSVKDSNNNESFIYRNITVFDKNSGSVVYLTFDDSPRPGLTDRILNILKSKNIKATFFVTGNGPDYLIKRMADEGHTIGIHTYSHNYSYIYRSLDNYWDDFTKINNRIKNITGIAPKIVRLPGGTSNTVSRNYKLNIVTEIVNKLRQEGYILADWNVSSGDADNYSNSTKIFNNVISTVRQNRVNIVLMHDKIDTVNTLEKIIDRLTVEGYVFDKLTPSTPMVVHRINN